MARMDEWLTLIAVRARECGIPPEACADRRDVENLLAGMESPLRHGWRAALIGRELQGRLAGGGHA